MLTRRARDEADAAAIEQVPILADALARVHDGVSELLETRWPALTPEQVAAAVRVLSRERSRLGAALLGGLRAVDDRDDVVPWARPGTAAGTFLQDSLGLDKVAAHRHAETARLLASDGGDLPEVGAALAAGEITGEHAEVAVRLVRRLSPTAQHGTIQVVDAATGELTERPCLPVLDATLAAQARVVGVPELRAVADRLVEHLNPPPTNTDAHRRRYLNLTVLPDGSLSGRFTCGPTQALALTAVIAAGSQPQSGRAVDENGVEQAIPDGRAPSARRMDALVEAVTGVHTAGTPAGSGATVASAPGVEPDTSATTATDDGADEPEEAEEADDTGVVDVVEPPPEGAYQVRRPAEVRHGPYPPVEIIVTATLDQLAAALARTKRGSATGGLFEVEGFARSQHGVPVHPDTLALLACSGRVRRVLTDRHGAVLHLGRGTRLATPAQRRALLARDGGCVIPGCPVPGGSCDVHHPTGWAHGGSTDVDNLALVCTRHHNELHNRGGWELQMIDGTPWARPPAWAYPARPLLRNTTHRTHGHAA